MDRGLLTIKEAVEYTGIGMTKMRQILNRHPEFKIQLQETNKIYIYKPTFDQWIKDHIDIDLANKT